jgi:hypothetical protein
MGRLTRVMLYMTDFCHKLRNVGQVFAPNREAKKPGSEIALKPGWGNAGQ